MRVGMIPIGSADVVGGNGDLYVVALSRLHDAHNVVGDTARTHVQPVRMEIGRVELMWKRVDHRHRIAVGRKVVDQLYPQHVAWLHAQGRAGDGALITSHEEPVAADILVGILQPQSSTQLSVHGATDLWLDEGRAGDKILPGIVRVVQAIVQVLSGLRFPASWRGRGKASH